MAKLARPGNEEKRIVAPCEQLGHVAVFDFSFMFEYAYLACFFIYFMKNLFFKNVFSFDLVDRKLNNCILLQSITVIAVMSLTPHGHNSFSNLHQGIFFS